MSQHTPAPWETSAAASAGVTNWDVCAANAGDMLADLQGCPNAAANAQRIVACVNACEGIDDPGQSIPSMKRALQNMLGIESTSPSTQVAQKAEVGIAILLEDLLSVLCNIADHPDEFGEIEDDGKMVVEMREKAETGIAIAQRAINLVEKQSHDEIRRALENLVDCAGITWLAGYKDELDAAMLQAREALATAAQSDRAPLNSPGLADIMRGIEDAHDDGWDAWCALKDMLAAKR